MNKLYIDFLAKELISNKLIIFVGAGASTDSKLPTWNDLIKNFSKELGSDKEKLDYDERLDIPEEYYKKFGKVPYYRILEDIFKKEFKPNSIHKALEKLEVNYVITTNFDTLIEDALNENYDYDIVKKDEDLAHTSSSKMIIKMHGDLDNKNIILKKSDFKNYEEKFPLVSTFIKGLFTTNTILFIGYSLSDPNVQYMISWIKKILKEDFRKVYLVDYEGSGKKENEEIINKIILPDLKKKEYSGMNEEELLNNKGKLLTDFLEDLAKQKEEKLIEENYLIYSKLDYLTEINFKKLIKNFYISFSFGNDRILNEKNIEENVRNELDLSEIKKYLDILVKSDIKLAKNKRINLMLDNTTNLDIALEKQEKLNEVLEYILEFDKEKFEKVLSENEEINTENLVISGYVFFEEYDLAREILAKKLKEYQLYNNKEKILWTYFLLDIIQRLDLRTHFSSEEEINLEKIYNKYFKRKTILYEEIINWKTLEKNSKQMNKYIERARKEKNSCFYGGTPLIQAQFLIRDIYKFIFMNGISTNFSEIKDIIKEYVEILFIAYKNDLQKIEKTRGEFLTLDNFNYYDYFFMIELSNSTLKKLFMEYNVMHLSCESITLDKLINALKNVIDMLNEKQVHFNKLMERLENILFLIYKHNLKEENFERILSILVNRGKFEIFYIDEFRYRDLQNCFLGILDQNNEYLSEDCLNNMINKIIESKTKTNNKVIGMMTYYYSTIISKKMEITEKLKEYFSINDRSVEIYFLRLFESNVKEKEIYKIMNELKKDFDLQLYIELLRFSYIEYDLNLENHVITHLDNIFCKKCIENSKYASILYEFYSLLENNKVSPELKLKLKNYNNENFRYYLKESKSENEWEYFLDTKHFDYSKFTISDLNSFTEYGIQKIIQRGKENKAFMKLIYEYLKANANNHILKAYLKEAFKENVE